jgi:uncharacterized protein YjdB
MMTLQNWRRASSRSIAIVAFIGGLVSCEEIMAPARVAEVVVSPGAPTVASLGDTVRLAATPKDDGGNPLLDRKVTWSTSDTTIITIDTTGLVKAVRNGSAFVAAATGGIVGSATVTVKQVAAAITLNVDTLRFASLGETALVTAVAKDARDNVMRTSFAWRSSDTSRVRIDSTGLATSVAGGTASLTASVDLATGRAAAVVQQLVASIAITPDSIRFVSLGDTARITAVARDARGNPVATTLAWTSSDSARVRVDSTGLATAIANGTASLSAAGGGKARTLPATVQQAVKTVDVTPVFVPFSSFGDTARFTATPRDARGSTVSTKVTWTSSSESRVRIDSTGLATTVANGSATFSAVADGVTGQASATVSQAAAEVVASHTARTFAPNETVAFSAAVRDKRGNVMADVSPTWVATNPSLLSVTGTGQATAIGFGKTLLLARYQSLADTVAVTIASTEVQPFAVVPSTGRGWIGAVLELAAGTRDVLGTVIPPIGVTTWSSSNTAVATVDGEGKVTGVGAGTVRITATNGTVSAFSDLTIAATAGGTVNVNLTLPRGHHDIRSTISVAGGVRLKIEPGATLKFDPLTGINVNGTLVAIGTASDSIRFRPAAATPSPAAWEGIVFANSPAAILAADGGYLEGNAIAYADLGYARPLIAGKLYFANNHAHHSGRVAFKMNEPRGVITVSGAATIRGNTFEDSEMPAIAVVAGSVLIQRNLIQRNGDPTVSAVSHSNSDGGGIVVIGGAPVIEDNRIVNNRAGWSGGAIAFNGGASTARYNEISNNTVLGTRNGAAIAGNSMTLSFNNVENNSCGANLAQCAAILLIGDGALTSNNIVNPAAAYEIAIPFFATLNVPSNYWGLATAAEVLARMKRDFVAAPDSALNVAPILTSRVSPTGVRPP